MAADVLGTPVKRTEDPRFITGKGRYLDDIKLPGHGPHGHPAQPVRPRQHPLDRHRARPRRCPGVLAVFVGADIPYNPLPMAWPAGGAARHPEQRQHAARSSPPTTSSGPARASRRSSPRRPSRRTTRSTLIRRRLGAAAGRRRRREGDPAGRAAAPRERARTTSSFEWTVGDKAGTDAAIDDGRGGRPPAARQPAADPQPDGGPGRHRLVQPGHRRVHDLDVAARRRTSSGCCSPPS